jgi:hypothetical protein
MKTEWIFDVLSDLRLFAQENGLPVLGEHLDDARMIAATELASKNARETQEAETPR